MAPNGPYKYVPEKCHELAESLIAYFQEPDSLYIESWACRPEVSVSMQVLRRIAQQNEEFGAAWAWVETVQASRLLELSTRPCFTEKGSTYYQANPQIARLVLASKHGFSEKHDVEITNLDGADRAPSTPEEADAKIAGLQAWKQQMAQMIEDAKSIGSALVGQPAPAFLPEHTTKERTKTDE